MDLKKILMISSVGLVGCVTPCDLKKDIKDYDFENKDLFTIFMYLALKDERGEISFRALTPEKEERKPGVEYYIIKKDQKETNSENTEITGKKLIDYIGGK